MVWFNRAALLFSSALLVADVAPVSGVQTIIPKTSFDSQSTFDTYWKPYYPWGTDHNGSARMNKTNIQVSNGVLTLTAKKVTGQPPASHGGKKIAINYFSGAVYAKHPFNVTSGGGYDYSAELKATTTRGTWPAFWLTAVHGWPPEIDMAEWKGSGKISFNTFNTSSVVAAKDVDYPDPGSFHKINVQTRDLNGKDVQIKFYMDGKLVATQTGAGYTGKPMWLYH
ncbi:glycoside hydrolase family 16 protein [Colletotrichum truncatum]|uniref:Glycoside hydrolase family 16 protein n=1 Tax=Colletotrichum truncatum TaxID=5467 RepID=A0ACC3ZH64_COLTU|nr:glycoside hydrolase family 16 protein [Colletotrichum truncatum]KAF6790600.1 glycoside hydrolase family 16 protein [Colletotrichum truncatum]